MPHNTYIMFALLDIVMAAMIMKYSENALALNKARQTLRETGRLATRVQAIWLAELITMAGMTGYNMIDSEGHSRAGLVVYPAMLVAAMYNVLLMDKRDKKAKIFSQQMNSVNGWIK